jgi:hypothetical protein
MAILKGSPTSWVGAILNTSCVPDRCAALVRCASCIVCRSWDAAQAEEEFDSGSAFRLRLSASETITEEHGSCQSIPSPPSRIPWPTTTQLHRASTIWARSSGPTPTRATAHTASSIAMVPTPPSTIPWPPFQPLHGASTIWARSSVSTRTPPATTASSIATEHTQPSTSVGHPRHLCNGHQ